MKFKRPESVLVVLYDQHHRVLVLQRKDDPDFWQSVTGTLEQGEVPIETAYREVAEETGYIMDADKQPIINCNTTNQYTIRKRWQHRYPPGITTNKEHVFLARVDSRQRPVLTEHLAFAWLDKGEAIDRLWSPSNRDAVQAFVPEAQS